MIHIKPASYLTSTDRIDGSRDVEGWISRDTDLLPNTHQ